MTQPLRRDTIGEDPDATTAADTLGAHVWWLLSDATVRHTRCVLNVNELPPGAGHLLHRHPHTDQVLYLARGSGWHLTDTEPIPMNEGDAIYVHRGHWHGFRNTGPERVTLLSIYPDVPNRAAAGYELHPDQSVGNRP